MAQYIEATFTNEFLSPRLDLLSYLKTCTRHVIYVCVCIVYIYIYTYTYAYI